ncbi:hypothetical protein EYF80_020104 [Liparis tanakae]|uniref:Uncharacterized protein n=1 Tax=Liparis tanakae TaxID=230148 RepID=A0A4Z2HX62_9TELE|nr:hypothetical protein EYF80_020104 [Liparis tanakae]
MEIWVTPTLRSDSLECKLRFVDSEVFQDEMQKPEGFASPLQQSPPGGNPLTALVLLERREARENQNQD